MIVKRITFYLCVLAILGMSMGMNHAQNQGTNSQESKGTAPSIKQTESITAIRTKTPINIDGILDEDAWKQEGCSSFIQTDPDEGIPATEKTIVWVAYDDKNLYVASRMYDSDPSKISGILGRRDESVSSDWFSLYLDPLFDRRSGYQFAVNPSGSIIDRILYNDEFQDSSWDGVWDSKARIDEKGWSVELRIPFEQLRFKNKDVYTWGINVMRIIKRKNEHDKTVWVPRKENGFVSRFARLEGIKNIRPGRFLEFVPYSAGKASYETKEEGNPFKTGKDYKFNMGMDMRFGLKSDLMLDVTVNPDFGQVEVDPASINLSASEIYYSEKRPFFIESSDIFQFGQGGVNHNMSWGFSTPKFYYSRRIGSAPHGIVTSDGYASFPEWANILMATKITGKIGGGWDMGFITALTQREYATVAPMDDPSERFKEEVEPASSYSVFRLQKQFNGGQQGLGVLSTGVLRNLRTDVLKDLMRKNAFALAVDGWTFLDKDKLYVISGWFGVTQITGSPDSILRVKYSYPHYYQRPDATYLNLNKNGTSLKGWAGRLQFNKQRGNFVVNAALGAISPGFDSTDMGYQFDSDVINGHVMGCYRSFDPGKVFRYWEVSATTQRNYNFGGYKTDDRRLALSTYMQLLNYWGFYANLSFKPSHYNQILTRGGPMLYVPSTISANIGLDSDDRKTFVISPFYEVSAIKNGTLNQEAAISFSWKPSSNFNISLSPEYEFLRDEAQWVKLVSDATMTNTYGKRYIFATIKQKTLSCSIRLNWIFNPKLTLQAYIQPYISVGNYAEFKELANPRSFDFNTFGLNNGSTIGYSDEFDVYSVDPDGIGPAPTFNIGNPNFNFKSLRGTIVLRWEYMRGSTIYAVWTQDRSDYTNQGDLKFGRDFKNLWNAPGNNIFMVKFTYRFKI